MVRTALLGEEWVKPSAGFIQGKMRKKVEGRIIFRLKMVLNSELHTRRAQGKRNCSEEDGIWEMKWQLSGVCLQKWRLGRGSPFGGLAS